MDKLVADGCSEVRLALPGQTEEQGVVATVDKLPRAQLLQLSPKARVEPFRVECVQRLARGQMGTLHKSLDPPLATTVQLEVKEVSRVLLEGPVVSCSGLDHVAYDMLRGRHSQRCEAFLQLG
jgi:hypothetical protein